MPEHRGISRRGPPELRQGVRKWPGKVLMCPGIPFKVLWEKLVEFSLDVLLNGRLLIYIESH
jgi:hypothetical protein